QRNSTADENDRPPTRHPEQARPLPPAPPPISRNAIVESQAHPSTTATAKATKKIRPVAAEYAAQPRSPSAPNRRANTKHAAMSEKNAIAAATKCSRPNVLIAAGGPGGVPGGNPSIGSARKMAAATSPRP